MYDFSNTKQDPKKIKHKHKQFFVSKKGQPHRYTHCMFFY